MTQRQAGAPDAFRSLTGADTHVKVVDIGASPFEGDPPYRKLLAAGDADVVGFEPNPDALAKLNAAKGPRETYLPYVIGDGGRHRLHICQAPGMTSLLEPNPAVLDLFHGFEEWAKIMSIEDVDTVRLDDVPETARVEMIKIDIQGAELMVLSNAPECLKTTLVVQTEVEFLQMYKEQPLFSEVEMFLREKGFMLHTFWPIKKRVVRPMLIRNDVRAGLEQVLWADAVFVRDLANIAELNNPQLLKLSCILHDCYGAVDLVYRLLLEFDKRTSSSLGETYLERLKATMRQD